MADATDDNLLQLPGTDAPVSPPMGVAMIAFNFALKYHDINTVQDGTLYQQYKLEGKNLHGLHLDAVMETARRIQLHLLTETHEISRLMVEGVIDALIAAEETEGGDALDAELGQPAAEGDAQ